MGPIEATYRADVLERRARFAALRTPPERQKFVRVSTEDRVWPPRSKPRNVLPMVRVIPETVPVIEAEPTISIREIIYHVAEKHGVDARDIIGPWRNRRVVAARQEAMYLCRERTMHSLPAIGRHFGNRDHTTILHGIRKHQERMEAGEV